MRTGRLAFFAFAQGRVVLKSATVAVPADVRFVFFRFFRRRDDGGDGRRRRSSVHRPGLALVRDQLLVHPLAFLLQIAHFALEPVQVDHL